MVGNPNQIPNAKVPVLQSDGSLALPWRLWAQGLGATTDIGVISLNAETGVLTLAAGENVTITNTPGTITVSTAASGGDVSATGSPVNLALAVWSGPLSITSGDLTGDVTTSASLATTLAASGVTAGSYISPDITVDGKGRITAAANGPAPIYVPATYVPGALASLSVMLIHTMAETGVLPANMAGSQFGATANATSTLVFDIDQAVAAAPNTWTTVGTITVASGGITAVMATTGGLAVNFAIGDRIRIIGPAGGDATLTDPNVTILINRTS